MKYTTESLVDWLLNSERSSDEVARLLATRIENIMAQAELYQSEAEYFRAAYMRVSERLEEMDDRRGEFRGLTASDIRIDAFENASLKGYA